MRRKRHHHREMRVWHDPLLTPASQQRAEPTEDDDHGENGDGHSDENGRSKRRRRRAEPVRRTGVRIIAGPNGARDPREIERERLLARLLVAEGRPLISAAVEAYLGAGFELPHLQDVWLQVLEHKDEERVSEAIAQLSVILEIE